MAKVIGIVFGVVVGFGIGLLGDALIVKILVWALNSIGVYSIGPVAVTFSWPLVVLFMVVYAIIRGCLTVTKRGN